MMPVHAFTQEGPTAVVFAQQRMPGMTLGGASPHRGGMSRQLEDFASIAQIVALNPVDL
jgi:hypothetical protein